MIEFHQVHKAYPVQGRTITALHPSALRTLMDKAAADVVTYRCAVQVQVRQAKDYPFVAALLSARVKKLDPAFKLQISQQLAAEQEPSLQLSPQPKS